VSLNLADFFGFGTCHFLVTRPEHVASHVPVDLEFFKTITKKNIFFNLLFFKRRGIKYNLFVLVDTTLACHMLDMGKVPELI
jgi:hypothetical protein